MEISHSKVFLGFKKNLKYLHNQFYSFNK